MPAIFRAGGLEQGEALHAKGGEPPSGRCLKTYSRSRRWMLGCALRSSEGSQMQGANATLKTY